MVGKEQLRLADLVGKKADDAVARLAKEGFATETVADAVPGPLAVLLSLTPVPHAAPGDHVRVFTSGGRVLGFAVDRRQTLTALRDRVDDLEQRVVRLEPKANRASGVKRRTATAKTARGKPGGAGAQGDET